MGISTRRSARVAQRTADATNAASSASAAAPASQTTPAGPVGGVKKAVSKAVSKAKAKTKAVLKKTTPKSPQKKTSGRSPKRTVQRSIPPTSSDIGLQMFPSLSLLNDAGQTVSTADIFEDSAFIVFLYPRANTPGCTTQACGFRDHSAEFAKNGYRAYGLSYDSPKSQSNWKAKHSLPYPLWCDTPEIGLIKALGAHKAPKGVKRSHFIVAKGGKILSARIQISPKESIAHALQFIAENPATANQNGKPEEAAKGAMDVDPHTKAGAEDVPTGAVDKDGDAAMVTGAEKKKDDEGVKTSHEAVEKVVTTEVENAAPEAPEQVKETTKVEVSMKGAPEKDETEKQIAAEGEAGNQDVPPNLEATEGEADLKGEAQKADVSMNEAPAIEKASVGTGKETIGETVPMDVSKDAPKESSMEAPKEGPTDAPKETVGDVAKDMAST